MFPINMQIGVGLAVLVDWDEAGTGSEYPVTVTVSDEGGVPVFPPWQVQFQVGKPDGMPRGSAHRVPIAVNALLPIPREGRYFVTATAGTAKAQTSFHAIFVGKKISIATSTSSAERGN